MFTDEQKAAIAEIVTASLKSATEKQPPADQGKEQPKSGEEQKTIAQEAKEKLEAENASKAALAQIQGSIKFNLGVKEFLEKNKNLLPSESEQILTAISSKNFADDNEKANKTRKSFLDAFLEKKENLEVLTGSMPSRAEQYKALAESDKEKRSAEFWDLVEVGVALKQGARKAETLNKINGVNAGGSPSEILEQKIIAKAREKFNNKK
jgi:hypothetical protein